MQLFASKQIYSLNKSTKMQERAIRLLHLLNEDEIDVQRIRNESFTGIPDEIKGLRPIIWRILLNHYPVDTAEWEAKMKSSKQVYDDWKNELIIQPDLKIQSTKEYQNGDIYKKSFMKINDHPLSINKNSQWNQYFEDLDIWEEIEKDVKRTRTDMNFFYTAVNP